MQCEMCGETVRGTPKLVRVEGAELQVCTKCEKFGTEVQQVRRTDLMRPAAPTQRSAATAGAKAAVPATWRKRDLFDYMEGEITEDYGQKIRKARMEKGLSTKELIPEEVVRKKLEKVLEIRLIDSPINEEEKKVQSKLTPTLGDLTTIKKVKK
jgi:putative transcription factor